MSHLSGQRWLLTLLLSGCVVGELGERGEAPLDVDDAGLGDDESASDAYLPPDNDNDNDGDSPLVPGDPTPDPEPGTGVASGTPGVWENVTPTGEHGLNLQQSFGGGDNYGVQDVLADPARPGDLYAFVCYQGVWRSTDYGSHWTQVNTGDDWGKPWGTAIEPNPDRDPSTPPVLYAGVSNAIGFLKSVDWGESWTVTPMPEEYGDYRYQQVYSIDIDPYDTDHLLVAFHEAPDMAESIDGGEHWTLHETPPGDSGSSYYPFFVNTGDPETTRKTWLVIPQEVSEATGLRTTDAGAHWQHLDKFQHHHGSAQLFDAGGGTIYLAAMNPHGVHKSTDYGVSWTSLTGLSSGIVVATSKNLYSTVGYGWGKESEPIDPGFVSAPRNDDGNWSPMPSRTGTAAMVDGAKRIAVTRDAEHFILVAGSWHAGIWRYIEP